MRLADRDRFVGRAGKLAVGHADAGGGEHLLAQPFRLRALAELGQALESARAWPRRAGGRASGRSGYRARWRAACDPTSARTPPGFRCTASMTSGPSGQVSPSATITLGLVESAMPLLKLSHRTTAVLIGNEMNSMPMFGSSSSALAADGQRRPA